MSRRSFVIGVPVLGLLALLPAACGGQPALTVAPDTYDFGDIAADAPVTTTLQVQNTGTADLNINGVTTSCGCTTAVLDKPTLAAGESGALTVSFDPQAHPGLYGPVLRVVYLRSNDPTHAEIEVPIHVTIMEPQEN